jgi:hypothetical protein
LPRCAALPAIIPNHSQRLGRRATRTGPGELEPAQNGSGGSVKVEAGDPLFKLGV